MSHPRHTSHRERGGGGHSPVLVLGAMLAVALLVAAAYAALRPSSAPTAPVAASQAPMTVELARVVAVDRPDTATVATPAGTTRVQVAGLVSPVGPVCGAGAALEHARDHLLGEVVTVVPDPTQPGRSPPVVHLVLASQMSYTDAALMDGMARAGTGQYAAVFRREASEAASSGTGLWASCWQGDRP